MFGCDWAAVPYIFLCSSQKIRMEIPFHLHSGIKKFLRTMCRIIFDRLWCGIRFRKNDRRSGEYTRIACYSIANLIETYRSEQGECGLSGRRRIFSSFDVPYRGDFHHTLLRLFDPWAGSRALWTEGGLYQVMGGMYGGKRRGSLGGSTRFIPCQINLRRCRRRRQAMESRPAVWPLIFEDSSFNEFTGYLLDKWKDFVQLFSK